jgi:hypothetical protein
MQHPSRMRHQRRGPGAAFTSALLGLSLLAAACQKEAPKEEPKPAAPAAAAPSPKPAAVKTSSAPKPTPKALEWDDPAGWKRVPPTSSMRYASYLIPAAPGDKEVAELNVFVLGGDIESNIQRWVDEFKGYDAKTLFRADRVVNDMTEAVVEIPKGTFSGGMNSDVASENFGLLGGIVVTPENSTYFFKLTGPSATVRSAREPFYALLDSVRLAGGKAAPETAKTVKSVGTAPAAGAAPAASPGATPAAAQSPAAAPKAPPAGASAAPKTPAPAPAAKP